VIKVHMPLRPLPSVLCGGWKNALVARRETTGLSRYIWQRGRAGMFIGAGMFIAVPPPAASAISSLD
jgi:hypothetical protein